MERICNLYISDEHLLVTLSNYLTNEINRGTKVIILSQDNMKKSIKNLKNKVNKNKLNEDLNCLENIDINFKNKNDGVTFIIKGENEFILKMENKINEMFNKENNTVNIVSCYNIKSNKNIEEVVNNYGKMLNTTGIINLKEKNDLQNV